MTKIYMTDDQKKNYNAYFNFQCFLSISGNKLGFKSFDTMKKNQLHRDN